jgi:hypothetical protein
MGVRQVFQSRTPQVTRDRCSSLMVKASPVCSYTDADAALWLTPEGVAEAALLLPT